MGATHTSSRGRPEKPAYVKQSHVQRWARLPAMLRHLSLLRKVPQHGGVRDGPREIGPPTCYPMSEGSVWNRTRVYSSVALRYVVRWRKLTLAYLL